MITNNVSIRGRNSRSATVWHQHCRRSCQSEVVINTELS